MDPNGDGPTELLARRARLTREAEKKKQELDDIEKQGIELDEEIEFATEVSRENKKKYERLLTRGRGTDGTEEPAYLQSELDSIISRMEFTLKTTKRNLICYREIRGLVGSLVAEASKTTSPLPFHLFTGEEMGMLSSLAKYICLQQPHIEREMNIDCERVKRSIQTMRSKIQNRK